MALITHRSVHANGIDIHLAEAGSGPAVLLLHGFPELWYSWRHQVGALADAGYRAVAPDLRGYGRTSAPPAVEDYAMINMVADVAGVLDWLGEDRQWSWGMTGAPTSRGPARSFIRIGLRRWRR